MGNESSNPIRNMDKRTARREYRESFTKAIEDFQLENNANPDAHPQANGPAAHPLRSAGLAACAEGTLGGVEAEPVMASNEASLP